MLVGSTGVFDGHHRLHPIWLRVLPSDPRSAMLQSNATPSQSSGCLAFVGNSSTTPRVRWLIPKIGRVSARAQQEQQRRQGKEVAPSLGLRLIAKDCHESNKTVILASI
jgi:hypothetical protein